MISNIYAQCDDYNQPQCSNNDGCEWIEDVELGNCSNYNTGTECDINDHCAWACSQWGSWYTWICYGDYYCAGGNYEEDNSYCQEIEMPECSEMNELQCDNEDTCEWLEGQVDCENLNTESNCNSDNCNWIEDFNYSSCSGFNQNQCYQYDGCEWTLSYGGGYGEWSYTCSGSYETDNSYCDGEAGYCEEIYYQLGDVNQDDIINIQDIIIVVNLILYNDYSNFADINLDSTVNVLDVIQLVNVILNN